MGFFASSSAAIVMFWRPAAPISAMLILIIYAPRLFGPHLCGTFESALIPTM